VSDAASRASCTELLEPTALAEQLEALERELAECLSGVRDPAVRDVLEASPGTMARVSKAVRGLADLFQATAPGPLGQRERELSFIVTSFGEGVRDLGKTNRHVATGIHDQLRKLDAIAQMPPDADCIAHLRAVAMGVQEVAGKMATSLDAMAVQIESTTERLAALESASQRSAEPDLYDKVTGLPSRGAVDNRLGDVVRMGGSWCLLLTDVDRLAAINARFGRLVGDALVFKIARIAEERVEAEAGNGFIGCFEGGSLGILLPCTLDRAADVAESVRAAAAASRWQYVGQDAETVLTTTVSIGLTQYRAGDTVAGLLQRAETALRRAKAEGRNRVVCLAP